MAIVFAFLIGLIFGTGIMLSGMANPAKVINFFDVAGAWDPSLAFVMGGALLTTAIGYRFVLMAGRPVFDTRFHLPTRSDVDPKLVIGSAIFGIGWGISGFCPGGALPALGTFKSEVAIFVGALLVGILLTRGVQMLLGRLFSKQPAASGLIQPAAAAAASSVAVNGANAGTVGRNIMSNYPVDMSAKPDVKAFFDEATNTISYIVKDPNSDACAVVDSVMDIDYAAGRITYHHADEIIADIQKRGLKLEWLIETHVHADHLSAAPYIQQKLGGKIGIGKNITIVQDVFGKIFNEGTEFQRDGSQFDRLFEEGDTYEIGTLKAFAMHTPGHTPACMTHVIGDAAFVGDTLFMPDGGSARADFPGGDAGILYDSIQKVLALPDEMRLFMCHDYGPNGREIRWETTVADEKAHNIHVGGGKTKEEFVKFRTERDAQLDMPKLIIPSLQVNMRAGQLPPQDNDGTTYLKVPVNKL